MAAPHKIHEFTFQFWRSPPPITVHYQSESFTRLGVDGIGKVRTGKRGRQFEAVVEEHAQFYWLAMSVIPQYHALPQTGPKRIVYNGIDYYDTFNHLYLVDNVEIVECQAVPRLTGPGYDFIGGARIVSRWLLTPYYIEPE